MKFYLDEDVVPLVAKLLRDQGLDAVSAHEAGATGLADEEQLFRAAEEGRCLVTRNRNDFIRLSVAVLRSGEPHCGVLIIPFTLPKNQPRLIADALIHFAEKQLGALTPYTVTFVQKGRK